MRAIGCRRRMQEGLWGACQTNAASVSYPIRVRPSCLVMVTVCWFRGGRSIDEGVKVRRERRINDVERAWERKKRNETKRKKIQRERKRLSQKRAWRKEADVSARLDLLRRRKGHEKEYSQREKTRKGRGVQKAIAVESGSKNALGGLVDRLSMKYEYGVREVIRRTPFYGQTPRAPGLRGLAHNMLRNELLGQV